MISKQELQQATKEWLNEYNYSTAMTLLFNKGKIEHTDCMKPLKMFFAKHYRHTLGRNWHKKKEQQYPFMGFIEDGYSKANTHIHLKIDLYEYPYDDYINILILKRKEIDFNRIWKHLIPSGSIQLEPIYSSRWDEYISKEATPENYAFITEKDIQ